MTQYRLQLFQKPVFAGVQYDDQMRAPALPIAGRDA